MSEPDELDTTADRPDEHEVGVEEATKREGSAKPKTSREPDLIEKARQAYLSRGALVGRYVVLDVLGEGGMGVVYSAFDPDLDRRVAIKLLQAATDEESTDSTGQQWLLREAQALARLSHPNVVSVHDVGTLTADRVFVAMELVDGETLRKWLREPRTWREIVEVMLAAGRGLAAAHSAGLVHRDFKPENVLVGADGRTRVMDFGLARLRVPGLDDLRDSSPTIALAGSGESSASASTGTASSELRVGSRNPLSDRLTVAGTVMGTPSYIAPELYREVAADARTDQFAFGVTLYESLFGMRPFARRDLQRAAEDPAAAVKPKPIPSESNVPAQIRRVVMRAIALAANDRYPSLDALLAELAIDPTVRRRRIALVAGAAAIAGGAMFVTATIQGSRAETPAELCSGVERRLAGVWDAAARSRVETAFAGSKAPNHHVAFTALAKALDGYASEWTKATTDSCEATRIRGDQTEDVMSLRLGCFDQRLEELRALVQVLGDEPSAPLVQQADRPVHQLEPLARCNNVAALREPGKPAPEIEGRVTDLQRKVAEAKAQLITGRYMPGLIAASKAADVAREIGWKPLLSEAHHLRGAAFQATGRFPEAAKAYADATWAALEGKRDDMVARSAFSSSMVAASALAQPQVAKVWLSLAESATRRGGTVERGLDLMRHTVRGIVLAESGDLLGAIAAHESAFKLAQVQYGKDGSGLFADEGMYATTLIKAFRFRTAIPHFEHAIALRTPIVGADHPDIAIMLSNLGISYRRVRDFKRAHETLGRALAIREKAYGKSSPLLVATLDNLADLYNTEGDTEKALAHIRRAHAIAEVVPGKDHPMFHQIATDHGEMLTAAGKYEEARTVLDEVIALETKTSSALLPSTNATRAELGIAERAWSDAERFATRSIAGFETAGGQHHPELVRPLTSLGRAQAELGKRDDAKKSLGRALAIAATTELHEDDLTATRAALKSLD